MDAELARYLRALMWLRWRILMRSLSRGRGRDMLERFSLATQSLAPIVAALVMVPASLGLGALGFLAGFWSGQPSGATMLVAVQVVVMFACGFAVFAPLVFPASADASGQVRLLLLPIPRGLLYLVQALGVIADPWIAVLLPLFLALPVGFLAAGRPIAALVALAAGALTMAIVVGLAMLSSSLLQLLLRNRRRGESVMVLAMFGIMLVSMLPSVLAQELDEGTVRRRAARGSQVARRPPGGSERRIARVMAAVTLALPPGQYAAAARAAAAGRIGAAAGWTGALALAAAALHAMGWRLHRRLLETPATSGRRRARDAAGPAMRGVPGLSPRAAAVAWAFVRLVVRTPRGKIVVFGVVLMMPLLAIMMQRAGILAELVVPPGFAMATFGVAIAVLALSPLSLNQFAADGAGLTLEFLSPTSDRELLVGKAVGGALVAAGPAVFALAVGIALSPAAPVALWFALVAGAAATYAVLAPVNALLSAIFPRKVNLASVGRDSNPHQGANLLGFLAMLPAAAPAALATAAGLVLLESAAAAAIFAALWCAAAIAISSFAFRLVERIFAARKENLLFVAQGR